MNPNDTSITQHVLESILKDVGMHTMQNVENRTIQCVFRLLSADPFHVCFSDNDRDQLMHWLIFSSSLSPHVLQLAWSRAGLHDQGV